MLETTEQGSSQSSFFASSRFLPCTHPWQKLTRDHHRTNKHSNRQLIDIVRLVLGVGSSTEPIAADVRYAWRIGMGGRRYLVPHYNSICDRKALRGVVRWYTYCFSLRGAI